MEPGETILGRSAQEGEEKYTSSSSLFGCIQIYGSSARVMFLKLHLSYVHCRLHQIGHFVSKGEEDAVAAAKEGVKA